MGVNNCMDREHGAFLSAAAVSRGGGDSGQRDGLSRAIRRGGQRGDWKWLASELHVRRLDYGRRMEMTGALHRAAGVTHAIMRIGAGLFFMCHGGQKLFGWFGGVPGLEGGTVPLVSQLGLAGVLELVGGPLLILGLLTRPVAAVLFLEMVVAYFQAHFPRGFWPIENGGEAAVLYGLIFLFMAANGGGPFSLDWVRGRGKRAVEEDIEVLEREAVTREYRVPGVEETRLRRTRERKPE